MVGRLVLAFCLMLSCLIGIFGGAATASAQATPVATDAVPVVIDSDMTTDDWMATLFVLNDPSFTVEAITVTGTGFAYCDAGVQSALGLLAMADYGDVPVSCWTETPLLGNNAPPADWRTTMETVEGLGLPEGGEPAASEPPAAPTGAEPAPESTAADAAPAEEGA